MKKLRVVILILILITSSSNLIAGEKKILNIASYHPGYSWTSNCIEGIESVVNSKYYIENHYMDTKRIPVSEFKNAANLALEILKTFKPDLVMIGDDNALKLLGKKIVKAKKPLVYYGINNNPRVYFDGRLPDNVFGVLERPQIFSCVRYIKNIIPDLQKILIMFDISPTSDAVISSTFKGKQNLSFKKTLIDLKVTDDWDEWKNSLAHLKNKYQAVIIVNYFTIKDTNGKSVDYRDVIRQSSHISPLPIFSIYTFAVHSEGAVGAFVIEGVAHGKTAGVISDKVLQGIPNIKNYTTQKTGKLYLSKTQLNRFNLKVPHNIEKEAIFQ